MKPPTAMRSDGLRAFEAAVAAVCPDRLVVQALSVTGTGEQALLVVAGSEDPIAIPRGVRLVAFGKVSQCLPLQAQESFDSYHVCDYLYL